MQNNQMTAPFSQKTHFFAKNGDCYKKNAYLCIAIETVFGVMPNR